MKDYKGVGFSYFFFTYSRAKQCYFSWLYDYRQPNNCRESFSHNDTIFHPTFHKNSMTRNSLFTILHFHFHERTHVNVWTYFFSFFYSQQIEKCNLAYRKKFPTAKGKEDFSFMKVIFFWLKLGRQLLQQKLEDQSNLISIKISPYFLWLRIAS